MERSRVVQFSDCGCKAKWAGMGAFALKGGKNISIRYKSWSVSDKFSISLLYTFEHGFMASLFASFTVRATSTSSWEIAKNIMCLENISFDYKITKGNIFL